MKSKKALSNSQFTMCYRSCWSISGTVAESYWPFCTRRCHSSPYRSCWSKSRYARHFSFEDLQSNSFPSLVATTMTEFIKEVDAASTALKEHTNNCISVAAGCELFTRYVTRTASDSTEVLGKWLHWMFRLITLIFYRILRHFDTSLWKR